LLSYNNNVNRREEKKITTRTRQEEQVCNNIKNKIHEGTSSSRNVFDRFNDPSAGSPTETLLRLLLPLGGRV
jgi:hypothetical protein